LGQAGLNSCQRVINAIAHMPDSPVARGELVIDRGFARDIIDACAGEGLVAGTLDTDLLLACCRLLNLDLVCVPAGKTTGLGGILAPPRKDIGRIADDGLFVFWLVDGAFQSAMTELGMMTMMTAMARSPDTVAGDLQPYSRQMMAAMTRGVAAGAHGIIIADDIAYQQGTYMSPQFVEQYLLPLWRAQAACAHDLGVPVFFHSDGNLNAVLPLIVQAGFDGLQCIEPGAGMHIGRIKAAYGQSLCLMGNIDPALLCESGGSPPNAAGAVSLDQAVNTVMAAADGRGGLIFGTCSGLHAGMQPKRVEHMYQLASAMDPVAKPSAD